MHQPHYIIELAASYFNLSAKEMQETKKIKTAVKSRTVAFILLHRYCAMEAYKIAPIFNLTEGYIKVNMSEASYNMVVQNAVKEIEDKYLIVKKDIKML